MREALYFPPEQIARFEAVLAEQNFPIFCRERFFGLSLADILGQPMHENVGVELGVLRELAELMATAMVADWSQRTKFRRDDPLM
jgi:hypothetical protein